MAESKLPLKYKGIGYCAWCGAQARTGRVDRYGKRYSACGRHRTMAFMAIPRVRG